MPVTRQTIDLAFRTVYARAATDAEAQLYAGFESVVTVKDALYATELYQTQTLPVARLYSALLTREPEPGGLSFYINNVRDGSMSLYTMAVGFLNSPEAIERFDYLNLPARAFVEALYRNILGRDGEEAGILFHLDEMERGISDRYQIAINFSRSPENVELVGDKQFAAFNTAPAAMADVLSAYEDTPVTFSAADLLGNDTDEDGNTLTISSVTAISGGTVVLNADGTVTFTGAPNFNRTASFSYTVSDGYTTSNSAVVTVNVTGLNDAPTGTATAELPNGTEDTAYVLTLEQLLAGFSDVDGDVLSVSNLQASNAAVVTNEDGSFTITPAANFNGTVNLTYNVVDSNGASIAATQSFVVAAVNDAPALTGTAATLAAGSEGAVYTIRAADLLAGYTDVDGDELSVAGLTAANGTLTDNEDGTWTFTPAAGYFGNVNLTYDVVDGQGGTAPAAISFVLTKKPTIVTSASGKDTITLSADSEVIVVGAGTPQSIEIQKIGGLVLAPLDAYTLTLPDGTVLTTGELSGAPTLAELVAALQADSDYAASLVNISVGAGADAGKIILSYKAFGDRAAATLEKTTTTNTSAGTLTEKTPGAAVEEVQQISGVTVSAGTSYTLALPNDTVLATSFMAEGATLDDLVAALMNDSGYATSGVTLSVANGAIVISYADIGTTGNAVFTSTALGAAAAVGTVAQADGTDLGSRELQAVAVGQLVEGSVYRLTVGDKTLVTQPLPATPSLGDLVAALKAAPGYASIGVAISDDGASLVLTYQQVGDMQAAQLDVAVAPTVTDAVVTETTKGVATSELQDISGFTPEAGASYTLTLPDGTKLTTGVMTAGATLQTVVDALKNSTGFDALYADILVGANNNIVIQYGADQGDVNTAVFEKTAPQTTAAGTLATVTQGTPAVKEVQTIAVTVATGDVFTLTLANGTVLTTGPIAGANPGVAGLVAALTGLQGYTPGYAVIDANGGALRITYQAEIDQSVNATLSRVTTATAAEGTVSFANGNGQVKEVHTVTGVTLAAGAVYTLTLPNGKVLSTSPMQGTPTMADLVAALMGDTDHDATYATLSVVSSTSFVINFQAVGNPSNTTTFQETATVAGTPATATESTKGAAGSNELQTIELVPTAGSVYTLNLQGTVLTSAAMGATPTLQELVDSLKAQPGYATAGAELSVDAGKIVVSYTTVGDKANAALQETRAVTVPAATVQESVVGNAVAEVQTIAVNLAATAGATYALTVGSTVLSTGPLAAGATVADVVAALQLDSDFATSGVQLSVNAGNIVVTYAGFGDRPAAAFTTTVTGNYASAGVVSTWSDGQLSRAEVQTITGATLLEGDSFKLKLAGGVELSTSALGANPSVGDLVTVLQADSDYASSGVVLSVSGNSIVITYQANGNVAGVAALERTGLNTVQIGSIDAVNGNRGQGTTETQTISNVAVTEGDAFTLSLPNGTVLSSAAMGAGATITDVVAGLVASAGYDASYATVSAVDGNIVIAYQAIGNVQNASFTKTAVSTANTGTVTAVDGLREGWKEVQTITDVPPVAAGDVFELTLPGGVTLATGLMDAGATVAAIVAALVGATGYSASHAVITADGNSIVITYQAIGNVEAAVLKQASTTTTNAGTLTESTAGAATLEVQEISGVTPAEGDRYILKLADGTELTSGIMGADASLQDLVSSLAGDSDYASAGIVLSVDGDSGNIVITYQDAGNMGAASFGKLTTSGLAGTGTLESTDGLAEALASASSPFAFDVITGFSLGHDKLSLPTSDLVAAGSYNGGVTVDAQGLVTVNGSDNNAIQKILTHIGTSTGTVAYVVGADTYVIQGDGVAGAQASDIVVHLVGVHVTDLGSIIV